MKIYICTKTVIFFQIMLFVNRISETRKAKIQNSIQKLSETKQLSVFHLR